MDPLAYITCIHKLCLIPTINVAQLHIKHFIPLFHLDYTGNISFQGFTRSITDLLILNVFSILQNFSVCNCSRCRQTDMDRHFPMTSPQIPLSACWMNPMDMHNSNLNSNFVPNPLPSRPCIPPRHVGMSPVTRVC